MASQRCLMGYDRDAMIKESRKRNAKRRVAIHGKEYVLYPEVFDPELSGLDRIKFLRDNFIAVAHTMAKAGNRQELKLLEIGTGLGYFAIEFALEFKTGLAWAADINPVAVENTAENAALHGVENRVKAIQADIFDAASIKGMKFDLIYFRSPTGYRDDCEAEDLDKLESAHYDPGLKIVRRYFTEARDYMAENAKLLLSYPPLLEISYDLMAKIAKEAGWDSKVLATSEPADGSWCVQFFELISRH